MYKWDIKEINKLLKYLKSIDSNLKEINQDITTLKDIKFSKFNYIFLKDEYKYNILSDKENYKKLNHYNDLLMKILSKYKKDEDIVPNFNIINSSKEDILSFTIDNLYNIDKKIGKTLEPYIIDKKYIRYNNKVANGVLNLTFLNKHFISLTKDDTISDFFYPTHEFLHIYSFLLNNNNLDNLEVEFLSILGELITAHEMKKNYIYNEEVIKHEADTLNSILTFLNDLNIKFNTILKSDNIKEKIKYLKKERLLDIYDIKEIYSTSLDYDYSTIISYFLALELFELYKYDKEKSLYISKNIIKSNKDFKTKLKENNIELLKNDDKYIKQLKKEYTILDNQ